MQNYILEMNNITKIFGDVIANDQISLKVKSGEIRVLVGENGSGKSTLMKILNGLYLPDKGELKLNGKKVTISSPSVAARMGIGMVYQNFMLIKTLTVVENMILGVEPTKRGFLNLEKAKNDIVKVSKKYGLEVDPNSIINELPVGMQQRVEILKILFKGANLLVFDEPSAVLTPQEVKELYRIMKNLIKEGKTIIFITHKLQEVLDVSDNITVLKKGKNVATLKTCDATKEIIANAMVGRKVLFELKRKEIELGKEIIKINNVNIINERRLPAVVDFSLSIRAGEIVGIAGVNGNGQTELVEGITGLRKIKSGEIFIAGNNISRATPREISLKGLAHIPEDRLIRAIIMEFDISSNLAFGVHRDKYQKGFNLDTIKLENDSKDIVEKYDVRPRNIKTFLEKLSGGNQQKVVVAREFEKKHKFLLCSQPTRGVDIGAIEAIHNMILKEKENHKAIMLVSAELSEIMALSDKIVVMFEGKINGILQRKDVTDEKLGILMAGGKLDI